jgi:hypothetical protein
MGEKRERRPDPNVRHGKSREIEGGNGFGGVGELRR